ncbi:hypothetical protein II898_06735 [bacterium]|nr:hypothetical protein [bacterium]
MPGHLKIFLIVSWLFFLFSCSSSNSSNDSDSIPDVDTDTQDSEIRDDDSDTQETEIVDNSDETSDADSDSDSPEKVECLDLRYNENTIKTPFPFKDANGKPTFCRPGCDTPTENDPQCVRNIWEWDNWEEYQVYLKAQEQDPNQQKERECYPWPCKLPDMHAKTKVELDTFVSSCDRLLTVNGFNADEGTVWSHGMFNGVVGTDFGHTGRMIEYNPEKDEYITLGQERRLAFNEERYIIESYDRVPGDNVNTYKVFTISVLRTEKGYFYELIRANSDLGDEFLRTPFAGKNWALLRLTNKTVYASSKDWEWHNLAGITNYAGEGNIVGDHLTFITNNRELYYCDLRKYPKHIDECFKLNRKDESGNEELGHSPRIDVDNEYRVVYNVYGKPTFVEVDLKDLNNPKYTEYEIEKKYENCADWEIDMLKGNMVSYSEMPVYSEGADWVACFYRFDKKKAYCQTENNFTTDSIKLMGYNVFWGKWHLWKEIGRTFALMRDWECYCKENNVCPLEPATEEELNHKPSLAPLASKISAEILERIEQEKILPKFDGNEVYFCTITERELGQFGNHGYCPTAAQVNRYLKHPDKSDPQLKDLILASKRHWKTEKSFEDLVRNHEKIWEDWYGCPFHKEHFECEYDEMTSTFDSDSVMFATVVDNGKARDGIFFRDRFYEANGNFAQVIKELREKFGASLRGKPRIELKAPK